MFANWSKETTTTTGTGALALSAVTGFPRFANHFIDGQPCDYAIVDSTGAPVEAGIGHYTASNTLTRDYITSKFVGTTLTEPGGTPANLGIDNTNSPWVVIATPVAQSLVPAMPAFLPIAAKNYMFSSLYSTPFGGSKTLSANTPICTAFLVEHAREIKNFLVSVATLSTGSRIQVGLYPVRGDGSLGPLLVRSGDMSPSSTGLKSSGPSGGSNVLVPPGYYLAVAASDVTPALSAFNAGSTALMNFPTPLGMTTSPKMIAFCVAAALSGGWTALPTTLGTLSGAADISSDFPPTILLEAA